MAEDILHKWGSWLPPSPHREAIFDWVEHGAASIVQGAPDEPPLLLFEDGGSMELSKARIADTPRESFQHADPAWQRVHGKHRATQYSEVCNTIDELKRLFAEEPWRVEADPKYIQSLIEDARYMVARMYLRQSEYERFGTYLDSVLCQRISEAPLQPRAPADEGLDEIERIVTDDLSAPIGQKERLDELAEQVRLVAQGQEKCLRERRRVALATWRAYADIKGPRDWSDGESGEPTPPFASAEAETSIGPQFVREDIDGTLVWRRTGNKRQAPPGRLCPHCTKFVREDLQTCNVLKHALEEALDAGALVSVYACKDFEQE